MNKQRWRHQQKRSMKLNASSLKRYKKKDKSLNRCIKKGEGEGSNQSN